jgi:hypothetical protein
MKNLFKALAFLALLVGMGITGNAQTALTQTTITAAVNGNGGYSGLSTSVDTTVALNSTTNINAPVNGVIQTYLYIDRELMGVTAINTTTKIATVNRGMNYTNVAPHVSGTMVLLGPNGAFQAVDPSGNCTAASTLFTPWVNVVTGAQWLCSTVTNTWVPGWGNPGNSFAPPAVTAAVASVAGTTLPSGPLFHVTGTNAITGWTIPVGFNGTAAGGGCFTVIPDALFTWTAAGNIALAGSAVVNKALTFCWDATNSKWVPNYIA